MSLPWEELRREYAQLIAADLQQGRVPRVCGHARLLQLDPLAALGLLEDESFYSLVEVLADPLARPV